MKIKKNDLYIDYSVSGNSLWYADSEIENPNCILVASNGSELWNELFPKIHINNDSINSKELLKAQRKSWLENELKELNENNRNGVIENLKKRTSDSLYEEKQEIDIDSIVEEVLSRLPEKTLKKW